MFSENDSIGGRHHAYLRELSCENRQKIQAPSLFKSPISAQDHVGSNDLPDLISEMGLTEMAAIAGIRNAVHSNDCLTVNISL